MLRSQKPLNLLDTSLTPATIIIALAWPTILEQMLQVSVTYIDSAMVGSLGAQATAAISVSSSTIWLVNGWMNALAIGYGVLMARNIGAKNIRKANQVVRQGFSTALYGGLALTILFLVVAHYLPTWMGAEKHVIPLARTYFTYIAVGYVANMMMIFISTILRLSGDSRTPLYLNGLNNLLNVILNLFLIFDTIELGFIRLPALGLGVKGAALGTMISTSITSFLLLYVITRADAPIRLQIRQRYIFDRNIQKDAFSLALPMALERSTLSLGQIALTKLVGGLGTTALAAHFLAISAESITYLPSSGFATAATTLVAQSLGSKNRELARKYSSLCMLWGTLLMSFMGLVLYFGASILMGFFTSDSQVIQLGTKVLKIESFAQTGFGLSILAFGIFRGSGDTRRPFLIAVTGMWLIRLPLALLLLRFTSLGLLGIWIAMVIDLNLRGLICFVQYRRFTWLDSWKETS